MRVQILPLPSVVVGDNVEEPFALIVDQHDSDMDQQTADEWQRFKDSAGARALLITPDTVEIVDRHAEPAPKEAPAETTTVIDGVLFGRRIRLEWPDGLPPELTREALATKVMNGLAKTVMGPRPIVLPEGNGKAINMEVTCSCGFEMVSSWSALDSAPGEATQERTEIACKICGNRLTIAHRPAGQGGTASAQDKHHPYLEDDRGGCAACGLGRLARVHRQ